MYHSWFDYRDAENIVRRTVRDPKDIKLVPTEHGEITPAEWRDHVLATPDPLRWDCFRFGIIQRADHFTFFTTVDHVHTDAVLVGLVLVEIHMMYEALIGGAAPIQLPDAGSYDDYCIWQRQFTSDLTLESPEVRAWIEFAKNNGGSLPRFPLPLGAPTVPITGDVLTVRLLDDKQTELFESACVEAGARFSGGVFACAAIAEHELTGADTYYVVTPITTRRSPADFATTGWFTGLVPITVPVAAPSVILFAPPRRLLTRVQPWRRCLSIARWKWRRPNSGLKKPTPRRSHHFLHRSGVPPLSPAIVAQYEGLNGRLYTDDRAADQIGMWVNRREQEHTVTVAVPE